MTALLTRLRIAGFKSFAEPAVLDILPGLTGIVGPNGCGKSNVVEALRWAMGETSVRSLRGGEMDDVIFAGTAARASRNLAEVTITLEKPAQAVLPEPFTAEGELQVTRRIERGAGSAYRANGRDLRARDVQTLFADLASGAHSSAMVSQGRVAALVNAKPEVRRQVLEEAAGITGLHARRHEAELKLRAAETNITRAEELRAQLDQGREGLRKQARQASRFRNLSGLLMDAETEFLAVQHSRAASALDQARRVHEAADSAARDSEAAVLAASESVAAAEAALPAPRDSEAACRSQLERRRLEAETLAEEAARAGRALATAQARLADSAADLEAATRAAADAAENLRRRDAEQHDLTARLNTVPAALAAAETAVTEAAFCVRDAEQADDLATARAADAAATTRQATFALSAAEHRVAAAQAAHAEAAAARAAAAALRVDPAALAEAANAAAAAEQRHEAARSALEAAEQHRVLCAEGAAAAGSQVTQADAAAAQAAQRRADASSRADRIEAAYARLLADRDSAESARIDAAILDAARQTAAADATAATEANDAALGAERAQTDAAASRLRLDAIAARLAGEHARLTEAACEAAARAARLAEDHATLAAQRETALAMQIDPADLAKAETSADEASACADGAEAALRRLGEARGVAEAALAEARTEAALAASLTSRLFAEAEGLRSALAGCDGDTGGLLDVLDVPPGLEAALGAAFAEAGGGLTEGAPSFWRVLPDLLPVAAPDGAVPLADLVAAPPALARALSHIFLAPDGADGDAVQPLLPRGATLVSRAGDAWRWDGHILRAGAPNAAAARLAQRARLRDIEAALPEAADRAEACRAAQRDAEVSAGAAAAFESDARATCAAATSGLAAARALLATLAAQAEKAAAGLAALEPAAARLAAEHAAVETARSAAKAGIATLGDPREAMAEAAIASSQADQAASILAAARATREQARLAAAASAASLGSLEQAASEAESRMTALAPQLIRLAEEHAEVSVARQAAEASVAELPDLPSLRAAFVAARDEAAAAAQALAVARDAVSAADRHARQQAATAARLHSAAAEAEHALAARDTLLARAGNDLARDMSARDTARENLALLPDAGSLAADATAARAALVTARTTFAAAIATQADLLNAQASAQARAPRLAEERDAWRERTEDAAGRAETLSMRYAAAIQEVAALAEAPTRLTERAVGSGTALQAAQAAHQEAAGGLRDAEAALRTAIGAQRAADAQAAACREACARGEGAAETAGAALASVLDRVAERLGPETTLPEPDDFSEMAEDKARRKLDRLQREREEMGPVNLRADIELADLDDKIAAIDGEREELATAIAKLRGSIGHLNREGRERLAAVFTEVDKHFRALFTRMMGGGRAHLALTGSEDPLEAGLEIYAEPPGKKLSTLSLLSGGEQALTALSLIFAVFRCTPAPVAVLDEVDAPLDDANVDRFCGLLEDVVRDTGTRFLVVTHHQLTMSRMDRLFGVTMQERGVSRLLSVDLQRAAAMVEPARHAAE